MFNGRCRLLVVLPWPSVDVWGAWSGPPMALAARPGVAGGASSGAVALGAWRGGATGRQAKRWERRTPGEAGGEVALGR